MRATALAIVFIAASVAVGQAPRVILDEPFDTLDPSAWMPATNGRWQVGAPHAAWTTVIDGRTVLRLRSDLTGPQRRGYLSEAIFPARACLVEVDFYAIEGRGVPLETWIFFPYGDAFVASGPLATGSAGQMQVETTASVFMYPLLTPWTSGRWYRFTARTGPDGVRLSLMDDAGDEVWSERYPWVLCDLTGEWSIGLLQSLPSGASASEAAIDHVRVTLLCGADFDGNGDVTVADAVLFTQAFAERRCTADLDGDSQVSVNDFVAFLNAMAARCP